MAAFLMILVMIGFVVFATVVAAVLEAVLGQDWEGE